MPKRRLWGIRSARARSRMVHTPTDVERSHTALTRPRCHSRSQLPRRSTDTPGVLGAVAGAGVSAELVAETEAELRRRRSRPSRVAR
eukprot:scaffold27016_cov25-Phaeocystis_antarctica.AAC.1